MSISDPNSYYDGPRNYVRQQFNDGSLQNQSIYVFDTLTFAPYERALIDVAMLDAGEVAWVDAYHAKVREIVGGQLSGEPAAWLDRATAPLLESAIVPA